MLNAITGEVTGLPQGVGVFDLNVTAEIRQVKPWAMQLIVNKTPPSLVSVPPKNLSSTSARFAGKIISDGGDPTTVSLFWGDNDGGSSTSVNSSDDTSWDVRIDLNGTYPNGGFNPISFKTLTKKQYLFLSLARR